MRALLLLCLTGLNAGCVFFGSPLVTCQACTGAIETGVPIEVRVDWKEHCRPAGRGLDCDEVPGTIEASCANQACRVVDADGAEVTGPVAFSGIGLVRLQPLASEMTPTVRLVRTDTGEVSEQTLATQVVGPIERFELTCGDENSDCRVSTGDLRSGYRLVVKAYVGGLPATIDTDAVTVTPVGYLEAPAPDYRLNLRTPEPISAVTITRRDGPTATFELPPAR
jgi:hypothetical protein